MGFLGGRLAVGVQEKNKGLPTSGMIYGWWRRTGAPLGAIKDSPWGRGSSLGFPYFGRKRLAVTECALYSFPGLAGVMGACPPGLVDVMNP